MSSHRPQHRLSVPDIQRRKGAGSLVALTAYSTPMARLLDPHADLLLVGDSLGMVLYGMPSTLGVSLEMMVAHTLAVMRGSRRAPAWWPTCRSPATRNRPDRRSATPHACWPTAAPGGEAGRR